MIGADLGVRILSPTVMSNAPRILDILSRTSRRLTLSEALSVLGVVIDRDDQNPYEATASGRKLRTDFVYLVLRDSLYKEVIPPFHPKMYILKTMDGVIVIAPRSGTSITDCVDLTKASLLAAIGGNSQCSQCRVPDCYRKCWDVEDEARHLFSALA